MDIILPDNITLKDILQAGGSRVDNYYYLPYWFEVCENGKIISRNINDIPEHLKELILQERDKK